MSKRKKLAAPDLIRDFPLLEELLAEYRGVLGADYDGYRNHCYRVFNLCRSFAGEGCDHEKIAIATLFHDLGIWTGGSFDYLAPSRKLAREYLEKSGRGEWSEEIDAMIDNHHKLSRYEENPSWLVEPFRKADWVDMSGGLLRFRLKDNFVMDVIYGFANMGFHRKIAELALARLKSHPLNPLPMLKR